MFYINAYGNEVHPSPNQDYLANLGRNDVLVYSCGSLWTRYACHCCLSRSGRESLSADLSIIPCLALRGVANAIARSRSLRAKILLCMSSVFASHHVSTRHICSHMWCARVVRDIRHELRAQHSEPNADAHI